MDKENQYLKKCSACNICWNNLDDLLHDDTLIFNGYQPFFKHPDKGSFLFTHDIEDCGTTFSVEISNFAKLLDREIDFFPFKPKEHPDCELRCVKETDLMPCAVKDCNGNVIRELIQIVKRYIQTPTAPLSEEEIDRIIDGK